MRIRIQLFASMRIRIRCQLAILMRIHANPDPDHSQTLNFLHKKYTILYVGNSTQNILTCLQKSFLFGNLVNFLTPESRFVEPNLCGSTTPGSNSEDDWPFLRILVQASNNNNYIYLYIWLWIILFVILVNFRISLLPDPDSVEPNLWGSGSTTLAAIVRITEHFCVN